MAKEFDVVYSEAIKRFEKFGYIKDRQYDQFYKGNKVVFLIRKGVGSKEGIVETDFEIEYVRNGRTTIQANYHVHHFKSKDKGELTLITTNFSEESKKDFEELKKILEFS